MARTCDCCAEPQGASKPYHQACRAHARGQQADGEVENQIKPHIAWCCEHGAQVQRAVKRAAAAASAGHIGGGRLLRSQARNPVAATGSKEGGLEVDA